MELLDSFFQTLSLEPVTQLTNATVLTARPGRGWYIVLIPTLLWQMIIFALISSFDSLLGIF